MNKQTKLLLIMVGLTCAVAPAVLGDSLLSGGGVSAGVNVSFDANPGPNVTMGEPVNLSYSRPFNESETVILLPWANFSSSGNPEVRADSLNGTWTNLSAIETNGASLRVNPNGTDPFVAAGGVDTLNVTDSANLSADDDEIDFVYSGDGVPNSNITVRQQRTSTRLRAIDADTGEILDTGFADADGDVTFADLPHSQHRVKINSAGGRGALYQTWLFVGVIALGGTWMALRTTRDDAAIIAGLLGFLAWGVFAYQSLFVVVVSDGFVLEYNYAPLALWASLLAVACLYVVITGPIALINQPRTEQQREAP